MKEEMNFGLSLGFIFVVFLYNFQIINSYEASYETPIPGSEPNNIESNPIDQEQSNQDLKIPKNLNEPYSKTDDEVIEREEESIKLDGLNVSQLKEMREKAEKFQFQAEVDRMMKLIINSLYTNKEIFLRELISNASDALDKIRLLSLTDPSILEILSEMSIKIKADKVNNILRITDTGIGMTREELIKQLGTIAKSGTTEFLANVEKGKFDNLNDFIGQFGVGFYSVYLVSDSVTVISKSNEDDQYIWESDSSNTFSVTKDPRGNTLKRGTEVVLRLKPSATEYLESENLRTLIRQYSQYLSFPIYLWSSKSVEKTDLDTPDKKEDKEVSVSTETDQEPQTQDKTPNPTMSVKWDWERINNQKPIWTRKASEISDQEYNEFFKTLSKTNENPLAKIHFNAEGEVTFKALLYIPMSAPQNLFEKEVKESSIRLYVRRVFITDRILDLIPRYLGFIIGIVDSDDLPLNVSRETLQQEKLMKVIQKKIVRKALDMIKKLNATQFETFWIEFRIGIKMGLIDDDTNRNRLTKLIHARSSKSGNSTTTFSEYISRMKSQQEEIFYIVDQNLLQAQESVLVEKYLKYDYEIMYFTDSLDEHALHLIEKFEGTKLLNLARGFIMFDRTEGAKSRLNSKKQNFKPLIDFMKNDMEIVKNFIENIVLTDRLYSAPMIVVPQEQGWTGNMERLAKSQSGNREDSNLIFRHIQIKKNLELNHKHPIIMKLNHIINNHADPKSDLLIVDYVRLLFETAILNCGYHVNDVIKYASTLENIVKLNIHNYGHLSEDDNIPNELNNDLRNKNTEEDEFQFDEKLAHAVPRDANKYASDESDDFDDSMDNDIPDLVNEKETSREAADEL